MDAVTEAGEYFIGYFAELQFAGLYLCYADTVHSVGIRGHSQGPKFDRKGAPVAAGKSLKWHHAGLGVDGQWEPLCYPVHKELLSSPDGRVDWHCMQPGSRVHLSTAGGMHVEALGYCERLDLDILPWRLGLQELIWGRFVSETDTIVWIEWKGEHPRWLLFHNGAPVTLASLCQSHVQGPDFRLEIEPVETLRQGHLGPNILSKVPAVHKLAPAALLQVHEHKQLGRGALTFQNGKVIEGWVIHETVVWPE
ncbi:hypothetical protein ATO10_09278 [Actibacterium atlanticum]|uniref:Uncharacterized protein n=1 Tax=Actibacterium atlanticum TaxID=1461693 RepID=A0A058ZLF2_9RHOB|nr:hypothetical protein [Actibacterium atlanticum]KCV82027.1 hypothetical protein ATO10_09278 [Actibacterium atlanticum]